MTVRIAQIVPRLQPGRNGLGDYACLLASQLARHDIETIFIVAGPDGKEDRPWGPSDIRRNSIYLDTADSGSVARALSVSGVNIVILQFAGYGYSANGAPFWLADGLEKFKTTPDAAIITMFHETWSKPIPWKKNFFDSFSQYLLARRLLRLSQRCVTNAGVHVRALSRLHPGKRVEYLPVVSNVGELERVEPKDEGLAVIFGRARAKERIYRDLAVSGEALGKLGISRIFDIGERVARIPPALRASVVEQGPLDAAGVSAHLRAAKYGLFRYPIRYVGKSGLFAAYAAHGVCPVNLWRRSLDDNESWFVRMPSGGDGAERGRHYLNWPDVEKNPSGLSRAAADVGRQAWQWYKKHDLSVTGRVFATLIADAAARI